MAEKAAEESPRGEDEGVSIEVEGMIAATSASKGVVELPSKLLLSWAAGLRAAPGSSVGSMRFGFVKEQVWTKGPKLELGAPKGKGGGAAG